MYSSCFYDWINEDDEDEEKEEEAKDDENLVAQYARHFQGTITFYHQA